MEIAIIIGLILLNGIFAMSEIAIISARRSSLGVDARNGSKGARAALKLSDNPDHFLSTVQVGITLIGILTGLYSGDALAGYLSPVLVKWGMAAKYAYPVAQISIVVIVTYMTIVFGELVPKRIGMTSAEKVSKAIARPMRLLSAIAAPFVWVLSKSTSGISNLLGIKDGGAKVTEEEIKSLIREGAEGGEVQEVEQDIMERVFILGDRDLESIMTYRGDIVWIDADMTKDGIREFIRENPFSKYPVCKGDLDDVVGIAYLKDMFHSIDSPDFDINKVLRPVEFLYESMKVYAALERMKKNHGQCALVSDEFGTIKGMVTLKDIMEALVGDIPQLHDDPEIVERKDGTYLVDGQCSFYNFLTYFKKTDFYSKYEYNTLSGLILDIYGSIPKTGDVIPWEGFTFEIMDMDGARIDKVLVTKTGQNQ